MAEVAISLLPYPVRRSAVRLRLSRRAIQQVTPIRSVLVDVISVLVMPVAVVHVVDVVPVLDRVAAVAVLVSTLVLGVNFAFLVLLAIVEMVRVVVVLDRRAPVIGQVLMVQFLGVRVHETSFGCRNFSLLPESLRRQAWFSAAGEQRNLTTRMV